MSKRLGMGAANSLPWVAGHQASSQGLHVYDSQQSWVECVLPPYTDEEIESKVV